MRNFILTLAAVIVLLVGGCNMRDREDEEGYAAGRANLPPTACPYSQTVGVQQDKRESWLKGWTRARLDVEQEGGH